MRYAEYSCYEITLHFYVLNYIPTRNYGIYSIFFSINCLSVATLNTVPTYPQTPHIVMYLIMW